jgi:endonuclease-3
MPRESREQRRRRAARVARGLARAYPGARTALRFESPFQLLVATILSAQCTDEVVNQVTAELFPRWGTPEALARAPAREVERLVHRTGFFRQKARAIQSAARDVAERFGGEVPAELEALVTLRGVARKTANVVLGSAFGQPALAVDTHMRRVNQRLGFTRNEDPEKIERDLAELLPRREWSAYTQRVIHHGRVCCKARRPLCGECPIARDCPFPRSRPASAA